MLLSMLGWTDWLNHTNCLNRITVYRLKFRLDYSRCAYISNSFNTFTLLPIRVLCRISLTSSILLWAWWSPIMCSSNTVCIICNVDYWRRIVIKYSRDENEVLLNIYRRLKRDKLWQSNAVVWTANHLRPETSAPPSILERFQITLEGYDGNWWHL